MSCIQTFKTTCACFFHLNDYSSDSNKGGVNLILLADGQTVNGTEAAVVWACCYKYRWGDYRKCDSGCEVIWVMEPGVWRLTKHRIAARWPGFCNSGKIRWCHLFYPWLWQGRSRKTAITLQRNLPGMCTRTYLIAVSVQTWASLNFFLRATRCFFGGSLCIRTPAVANLVASLKRIKRLCFLMQH